LSKLIIHPRTREQFYGGEADINVFEYAYNNTKNPLCYNGDIFEKSDFEKISVKFPQLDSVMIGRGAIGNPFIFEEIIALSEGIEYRRPSLDERAEAALYQLSAAVADKGEAVAVRESRKQIALYLHSFRGAAELRRRINSAESYEDVQSALYAALSEAKNQGG
jgi:tRNA-dihydrouridine synthase